MRGNREALVFTVICIGFGESIVLVSLIRDSPAALVQATVPRSSQRFITCDLKRN